MVVYVSIPPLTFITELSKWQVFSNYLFQTGDSLSSKQLNQHFILKQWKRERKETEEKKPYLNNLVIQLGQKQPN
jgi:hypothetical protein